MEIGNHRHIIWIVDNFLWDLLKIRLEIVESCDVAIVIVLLWSEKQSRELELMEMQFEQIINAIFVQSNQLLEIFGYNLLLAISNPPIAYFQ